MPKEIYLVKVGMTMTEGMVAEWYIPDGGSVKKGELVYALETEKVNLDVDAEADGIVKHAVAIGEMLEPGDVVGYIFGPGEEVPETMLAAPAAAEPVAADQPAATPAPAAAAVSTPAALSTSSVTADGRIKSSPAARRLARELGIDYTRLTGTGPDGRIIEADVSQAKLGGQATAIGGAQAAVSPASGPVLASPLAKRLAAERGIDLSGIEGSGPGGRIVQSDLDQTPAPAPVAAAPQPLAGASIPVKGMRKTIAQRMKSSLDNSAQLTMDMQASMDDAVKLRESLIAEWQAEGVRPTYTDLVVRAAAKALVKHTRMNSVFAPDQITIAQEVNIGIAVALPEGLVVPVIRNADQLSVKEIAQVSSQLAIAARDGKLGLDDYAGGTFTVSALGMYGVDSFTPIINEPQSGILGVNRIYDGLEWEGETPVKRRKMNLSLTWDHRVLDGAPAAEFLQEVCELLSNPFRLLV